MNNILKIQTKINIADILEMDFVVRVMNALINILQLKDCLKGAIEAKTVTFFSKTGADFSILASKFRNQESREQITNKNVVLKMNV